MQIKEPIPKKLLKILACPLCKSDIKYNKYRTKLICTKCKAIYPIKDGIPILFPPEMQ
ncbi:Trm112 family protein [Candidatus Woesearchaeota archaeon]|nr:Trm112 family protein [Candidatus Woesearchaeota archaeon]MBU3942136.1 Trm112 family protein [Nanoarchaeota archaeon]